MISKSLKDTLVKTFEKFTFPFSSLDLLHILALMFLFLVAVSLIFVEAFLSTEHAVETKKDVISITSNAEGLYLWENPTEEYSEREYSFVVKGENGLNEQMSANVDLSKVIHVDGLKDPYIEKTSYEYFSLIDWLASESKKESYIFYLPK